MEVNSPLSRLYMKIIFLILISILFFNIAFCDQLEIPYSCYPKILQERFADNNLKLDLSGNDRTQDSWGFIENKGTSYKIFTYRSVTPEELSLIMKIARESING